MGCSRQRSSEWILIDEIMGERMNILIIVSAPEGGVANAVTELIKSLQQKGCSIVLCVNTKYHPKLRIKRNKTSCVRCSYVAARVDDSVINTVGRRMFLKMMIRRSLAEIPAAVKLLEREVDLADIDLIYTPLTRDDLGCYISRKYGIPHVVHLREFYSGGYKLYNTRLGYISLFNRNTDCFIAVSNAVKRNWAENGIDARKIITVYDGVNSDITVKGLSEYSTEGLKIVMAGYIHELKGQHICIKALSKLPVEIRSNIFVDFVGWENSKYRCYLDNLIKEYDLSRQVRFLGPIDSLYNVLDNYDVGIMASRAEGFGLVTAEYMMAGLCVIASDSGANPEIIENGVSGLIFSRNRATELAECIEQIFHNRELMVKMALCGHEKAKKEYTAEKNAEEVYNVFKRYAIRKNR